MVFCFTSVNTFADVKMLSLFSDGMVLQRDKPVNIWGWANVGESITVSLNGHKQKTKGDKNGRWIVSLPAMPAGGSFDLEVKANNTLFFRNVTFGDVWICSGQSNMEWSVNAASNATREIQQADFPDIRLFVMPNRASTKPLEDIEGTAGWEICSPETIGNFSAVGYFFGRDLHANLNVPIGLISSDWGGTIVEAWTSADAISVLPEFKDIKEKLDLHDQDKVAKEKKELLQNLIGEIPEEDRGLVNGNAYWADPDFDFSFWKKINMPSSWETSGLPDVDGVVWLQTTFDLKEDEIIGPAVLNLGPVDDSDITWINGKKIGATSRDWKASRAYQIDHEILHAGKNTLVVRVEDTGGLGGFGAKTEDFHISLGHKEISLAGDWRYKVGKAYINLSLDPNSLPSLIFNGMINPLTRFGIKGVIWYQGESNASNAFQYRTRFKIMIEDWRKQWGGTDFPFLFVQLANINDAAPQPVESEWAELREAQAMALSLPKTGMAVTIDIGEANDIHPKNKRDVGKRLALAALHVAYGKDIVYTGPVFKSMKIEGQKVRITFDYGGSNPIIKDKYGYVKGFAIAGLDRKFHWAKGELENDQVVIWCDQVKEPVAIRYAWSQNPDDANIFNDAGLPALPFRTDNWKGVTEK
jgi:sialate O-acetylesterase